MIRSHRPQNPARLARPRRDAGAAPPACDCGTFMERGELRLPRPGAVNRIGLPPRPASLPVWRCPACGCQQPRIDA